jgi:hypothetical protein
MRRPLPPCGGAFRRSIAGLAGSQHSIVRSCSAAMTLPDNTLPENPLSMAGAGGWNMPVGETTMMQR